ncbi:MAG: hypothetical protein HY015_05235 [Bacteroidetes bacterium]|nr:hypothetical protein [Bacteroidota bacterium]MBI3482364.1 hypothetical protein [Bacteroidota bacterium]
MAEYKIHLAAGSTTIEIASSDKKWVAAQEKKYATLIEHIIEGKAALIRKPPEEGGSGNDVSGISSKLSINEFYRKYIKGKVISRNDIATFFIFFLTKTGEKKEFAPSEIKELFKSVGYPDWNSINISDVLNQARKKALLNSVNNQWSLSITGEDFVLNAIEPDGEGEK